MTKLKRCNEPDTSGSRNEEADHRIGNSLAFLSAMLRFESRRITSVDSARLALLNAANRLGAVSRVHFALARNGGAEELLLSSYLADLAINLSEGLDIDIDMDVVCEDMTVAADLAVCLAVVINELATNSVKYAGASDGTSINVNVSESDGAGLVVTIRDNGKGLPDGFDIEHTTGLGMTIITSTIRRHNGRISVEDGSHATFRIEFPS